MSDYTEHLISMAGGDGDQLAEIEARRADCQTYNFGMRNADKLAHEDVPYLLAMVREQRAALDLIANQANAAEMLCRMNGMDPELASVPAGAIRAAITATVTA
jgi:hypothetical protein